MDNRQNTTGGIGATFFEKPKQVTASPRSNPQRINGLWRYQQLAFDNPLLKERGLTVALLQSDLFRKDFVHADEYVMGIYNRALVSLMTTRGDRNRTAEQAVNELRDLRCELVWGIARGLDRADVEGMLTWWRKVFLAGTVRFLVELKERNYSPLPATESELHALCPHLACLPSLGKALINLMMQRGALNRSLSAAMEALKELLDLPHNEKLSAIARGLEVADVELLTFYQARAIGELHLSLDQMRSCSWGGIERVGSASNSRERYPNADHYYVALTRLLAKELEGPAYYIKRAKEEGITEYTDQLPVNYILERGIGFHMYASASLDLGTLPDKIEHHPDVVSRIISELNELNGEQLKTIAETGCDVAEVKGGPRLGL